MKITLLSCTNSTQAFRIYYVVVWFGIGLHHLIYLGFVAVVVFNICSYVSLRHQRYTSMLKFPKATVKKVNFFTIKSVRNKWCSKHLSCIWLNWKSHSVIALYNRVGGYQLISQWDTVEKVHLNQKRKNNFPVSYLEECISGPDTQADIQA